VPEIVQIETPPPVKSVLFPEIKIKNIALFYLLTTFNNLWFIAGNWIFFWTRFMTYGQLGWVDASAFAFGLLMEVPSGAVSDLLGKKRTIVASMLLAAISIFGFASASSLTQIWISFMFAQLGWALYSGSAEALAYDTLVDRNKEQSYDKVISTSGTIATISAITATLLGGLFYVIHFRLPHYAWAFAYALAFFISLFLTEPKIDTEKFSLNSYVKQLYRGTVELFKPQLQAFVVVIFVLLGADYLYSWGLIKPAMATSFGFFDKEQAILFALFGIVGAILVKFIPSYRKYISDKRGLYFLSLVMGSGFMLAFFKLGYLGVIPLFLIAVSGQLAYPWVSIVVNREIASKYRATTLSTVALISKLPYALLAITAGAMVENGTFHIFNLTIGSVIIASIVVSSIQRLIKIKLKR
jgi:MFS family permease